MLLGSHGSNLESADSSKEKAPYPTPRNQNVIFKPFGSGSDAGLLGV